MASGRRANRLASLIVTDVVTSKSAKAQPTVRRHRPRRRRSSGTVPVREHQPRGASPIVPMGRAPADETGPRLLPDQWALHPGTPKRGRETAVRPSHAGGTPSTITPIERRLAKQQERRRRVPGGKALKRLDEARGVPLPKGTAQKIDNKKRAVILKRIKQKIASVDRLVVDATTGKVARIQGKPMKPATAAKEVVRILVKRRLPRGVR